MKVKNGEELIVKLQTLSHRISPAILEKIQQIQSHKELKDADVERLRAFFLQQQKQDNSLSEQEALYDSLLILAEFCPINAVDPMTLDTIPQSDRIVVSLGHQFSLPHLIAYHNNRHYRGSALQEEDSCKWLLNPITNQPFNARDAARISLMADKKGLIIENLKKEHATASRHLPPTARSFHARVNVSRRLSLRSSVVSFLAWPLGCVSEPGNRNRQAHAFFSPRNNRVSDLYDDVLNEHLRGSHRS